MKPLLTWIPLGALTAMAVVVFLATREAPKAQPVYGSMPEVRDLESPDLGLGTEVIAGVVLGVDGAPIEGASLFVIQAGRPSWTFTNREGQFQLTELHGGAIEIALHAPGHQAQLVDVVAGEEELRLKLAAAIPAPPTLPNPVPMPLVGRIAAPGVDLSGFEVAFLPVAPVTEPGTGVPRRTECRADGSYAIQDLVPGEYEVLLLPEWATGGSWPDLLTELHGPARRVVHPGNSAEPIEMVAGTIAGSIFDGEHEEPFAGALVVAIPVADPDRIDPRRFPPTRTDREGAYRLELLPPGRYRVEMTAGDERRSAEVLVTPGGVSDPGL